MANVQRANMAVYEKMANVQKANMAASSALAASTTSAVTATANSLKRAKKMFATKIGMLTNVVVANAKRAERDLTAVVHNIAKAAAADRNLIKEQTKAMEADLNKAITRAIQIGEAKAKAVEQRIAAHLKSSKRFLQVE